MTPEPLPSALDRHFAELMNRLAAKPGPELQLAALLASHHQGTGNICWPLREAAGQRLTEKLLGFERTPEAASWTKKLRATEVIGEPGEFKPLILDQQDRLYLRRYWEYEDSLAKAILARLNAPAPIVDRKRLEGGLDRLFPKSDETDWQRVAAANAVTRNFSVITGGPGTGKTRTVIALLVLLLEQNAEALRIALVAPSGKAAARLKESIENAKAELNCAAGIKDRLPTDASTIHRLLGTIPDSPYFRHDADRPLVADAVIVDEASMVDLATMAKLFAAIPPAARVILLGDKDQLTSVEAGYVLGDICHPPATPAAAPERGPQLAFSFTQTVANPALQDAIVELRRNYRFPSSSGIYRLVTAINEGDADEAMRVLKEKDHADVTWKPLPNSRVLAEPLRAAVVSGFRNYLEANDPAEALQRFSGFRVLCAVRQGPFGVMQLNKAIEQALAQSGLLREMETWYRGRPVMVTRNDYNARLFNGDIGIVWPDPEGGGETRVFFPTSKGETRRVLPSRLPVHETAFAMTVHKSQGSEFEKVLLILPENDSPILTRELLYTGVTRAREGVELWTSEPALRAAIGRRVTRTSGLRDALSGRSGDRQGTLG
jgi:exodeoxyribonuclease V alpha subunit